MGAIGIRRRKELCFGDGQREGDFLVKQDWLSFFQVKARMKKLFRENPANYFFAYAICEKDTELYSRAKYFELFKACEELVREGILTVYEFRIIQRNEVVTVLHR